jgi:hypothetical protein
MKSRRVRLCLRLIAVGAMATAALGAAGSVSRVLASVPTCGSNGAAVSNTCSYTFTGQQDLFVPPSGVSTVSVDAIGGAGGNENPGDGNSPSYTGGKAAHVLASGVSVTAGTPYSVNVGGNGLEGDLSKCSGGTLSGGYNGGGTASECGAGSGGGASVVSLNSAPTASDVVVVAGGGGGAGEFGGDGGDAATGNTANGSAGPNCGGAADGGGGGTTTSDGAGGGGFNFGNAGSSGSFLKGGDGDSQLAGGYAGGGGAGFHGGGGGGSDEDPICGGPGGAGSSYAASGTATYTPDTTGTPGIVISWAPTVAAASGLHVSVARGWTTMTWRSTSHVLGFNVYRGSQKLNRTLVDGASQRYTFRVHAVVRHPVLRAVMQR